MRLYINPLNIRYLTIKHYVAIFLIIAVVLTFYYLIAFRSVGFQISYKFTTLRNCPKNKKCIAVATPYFKGYGEWRSIFNDHGHKECSAKCQLVQSPSIAHAVAFHGFDLPRESQLTHLYNTRPKNQKWIFFSLESPVHLVFNRCIRGCRNVPTVLKKTIEFAKKYWFPSYLLRNDNTTTAAAKYFDWTIGYRRDSTFRYPYYGFTQTTNKQTTPKVDMSSKKYMSYAVISNCHPYNNRMQIIAELQKYIPIHVYGYCGDRNFNSSFYEMSKQYYFYISFENAFCKDYITEKFFSNGLLTNSIPVAFGGHSKQDYEIASPPKSFIYGPQFPSAKNLAAFMKNLAKDKTEYLSYFNWRKHYKIVMDSSKYLQKKKQNILCNLCDKLWSKSSYKPLDLNAFYQINTQCRPPEYSPFRK